MNILSYLPSIFLIIKSKIFKFLKSTAFFILKSRSPKKIPPALSAVVKLPSKSISCGLIITFLLLAFLQLLIRIAADLFVRTVVKPSLNPIPLVLRTSFSPMRFSIQLPKLYITSTQLIRISLTRSTFLFLWFSSMPTAFLSPLASLFLSILELMKFIPPWRNREVPIFVFSLIMKNVSSMIFSLIALNELSPDTWIPSLKQNGIVFSSLPSTCGSLIVTSLTAISKTRRSLLIRFMSLNILRWPLPVFVLIL